MRTPLKQKASGGGSVSRLTIQDQAKKVKGALDSAENQIDLSKDLNGDLNQNKLEDVTVSLQGIVSDLQTMLAGNSNFNTLLMQINSQLEEISRQQAASLSLKQQRQMRASLQKIVSELQNIVDNTVAADQEKLQNEENALAAAKQQALKDKKVINASYATYSDIMARLQSNIHQTIENTEVADNVYFTGSGLDESGASMDFSEMESILLLPPKNLNIKRFESLITDAIANTKAAIYLAKLEGVTYAELNGDLQHEIAVQKVLKELWPWDGVKTIKGWKKFKELVFHGVGSRVEGVPIQGGYCQEIGEEAHEANSYFASAQGAKDPSGAIKDLNSLQDVLTKMLSQGRIAQKANHISGLAGFSAYHLKFGEVASEEIGSVLQAAKNWTAAEASLRQVEAFEKSLAQAISQTEEQLKNLKSLEVELELDARILSEPFPSLASVGGGIHASSASYSLHFAKHVPTPAKPQSSAIQTPAAPSEKLAATGSTTQDIWIASAALLACGIAAEAIKKGRERRSRGK